jgi:phosphoribosylformylglycinamidine synthase I
MKALILRAPGLNRDMDAAHACTLAGFEAVRVHINTLIKNPDLLLTYQFLVIPGGFSYGDDFGGGTLLAKNLTIHLGPQISQFIDEGRPVLGICNGFQVLVRAGLLPGCIDDNDGESSTPSTLTDNVSGQFECRWVTLSTRPSPCIFTQGIDRLIETPVAHGEGQFIFSGELASLQSNGQVALVYSQPTGYTSQSVDYPANPNGSRGNVAGICNRRGNVLGLMPHPENYVYALQHPQRRGNINGEGDGLLLFKNAYTYVQQLQTTSPLSSANPTTTSDQVEPIASSASSYAASGVNIDAGEQAVHLMREAVRASQGPEVLAGIGAFAGVFSAKSLQKLRQPALVSSTDSVGTKTLLAVQANRYDTVGYDIVNHSVNDMLAQGARPLFFMDYLAVHKLDPVQVATIVQGVADACSKVGCALLGGETAEMPDVYQQGTFDLAGTIVGVAEEEETHNGTTINEGDLLLGLPSNGLHTNGYSLARRIFAPYSLDTVFPELGEPLTEALLRPHRCYLREITTLRGYLADRNRHIKGIAHITGGGFQGNISRILPIGLQASIDTHSWHVPPLFELLARLGLLDRTELYRTFNMGIGMVIVLAPKAALEARSLLPELTIIGKINRGDGVVLQ